PPEYILGILAHYLAGSFSGNVMDLWPHLQTINRIEGQDFKSTQNRAIAGINISAEHPSMGEFFQEVMHECNDDCNRCGVCEAFRTMVQG
ncbi:unnamed protein product, partial [marine sediment metagenome]